MRELLGTWQENAARFRAGQTVTGVVRTVTDYGAFIALTPNLCGLAEPDGRLRFTGGFPDADSVLSWVLTFGDKAELLEPEELRERLGVWSQTLADRYRGRD